MGPLRTHGWHATVERSVEHGEYLVISAERSGHSHRIAIMYSSATKNEVYKSLATEVEHIFINGQLYKLESFAYGIDKPVTSADDFHEVLLRWNRESAPGKFVQVDDGVERPSAEPPQHRVLLSEQPIQAVWLRLRQLQSVTLAAKMVAERARREQVVIDPQSVRTKAEGIAYALRNAADHYHGEARNVSQRVLNLYYRSLGFASPRCWRRREARVRCTRSRTARNRGMASTRSMALAMRSSTW